VTQLTGPVLAYHATLADDFDRFEFTEDIGFHFGTREAANKRFADITAHVDEDEVQGARILICSLHVSNPLRLDDCHTWGSVNTIFALRSAGALSDAEQAELVDGGYLDAEMFRDIVEKAGYDCVVYANETEGGGDSYIILRPEHICFALQHPPAPAPAPAARRRLRP
jgi:hypothetical protein